ncbi:MAG: MFS transporter [Dehalococcoidia bacterium]
MFASAPGQTYTFSVFLNPVIEELRWSQTLITTLYFFGSLTAAGLIVFVGRMLDRFGPRIMLVAVAVVFGLAALWMSRVDHPFEMYAGFAAIRTLGQGALTLIPATMVSMWFVRSRGKVLAIATLGGALASGAFPPLVSFLISQVGWREAWVALGFIIWGLLIIPAAVFVRRMPESVGLLPDGDRPGRWERGSAENNPDDAWTLSESLRTRSLWLLIIAGSAQSLIGTGLMFHQVKLLSEKGLDPALAASVFTVIAPMLIVGQFLGGFLSDRFSMRYLMAGGQISLAVAILLVLAISEPWQAYVYGALLGLTTGSLMNINHAVWPAYFGRKHLGSIRGVGNVGMMASAAFGPLPLAYLFDQTGAYTTGLILFLALPPISAAAAFFAIRPRKTTPSNPAQA